MGNPVGLPVILIQNSWVWWSFTRRVVLIFAQNLDSCHLDNKSNMCPVHRCFPENFGILSSLEDDGWEHKNGSLILYSFLIPRLPTDDSPLQSLSQRSIHVSFAWPVFVLCKCIFLTQESRDCVIIPQSQARISN